jgi:hypothetical protein
LDGVKVAVGVSDGVSVGVEVLVGIGVRWAEAFSLELASDLAYS